jgi:predicted RecB family nuclease
MFLRASQLVLSPTDLAAFLACRHRTGLDLAVARGELAPPVWRDPLGQAFRDRGLAHERAYVASLRARGREVTDLADAPEGEREARTQEALRAGVPAVAQGVLAGDGWRGYADVLVRVDVPSALGSWSYEVHDTKLARETRGGTVLQLAVYSDLLGELQGRVPERFHVVAPAASRDGSASGADEGATSAFDVRAYRVGDYAAFVHRVRAELLRAVGPGGGPAVHPESVSLHDAHYPEPVEACGLCRWAQRCDERRRADDHLSFIAGIGRWHRAELVLQGHGTLAAAAAMPLPIAFTPKRGSRDTYVRLREQARVQHQQRTSGAPVHELLLPVAPDLGLARLPEPSPGDVFLDLEGARFARDGGREYLFGLSSVFSTDFSTGVRPLSSDSQTIGTSCTESRPFSGYSPYWAQNDFEERAAFESVIDHLMQAWSEHPGLHVYHFGHYEPSTFKRLMGRHATRADELDRLLRAERFVDLHAVVRQALRAGVESYSIKQLEQFYGFERAVPLDDAAAQMQVVELALEGHAPEAIPIETRAAVQAYNEDDCRSTAALRDWLETLRSQLIAEGTEVPRPQPKAAEPPPAVSDLEAAELAATARLLQGLPPVASQPQHPQHPRWLLAQLLGWHRREDKAQWWERYRLNELPELELAEEGAAIVGLEFVERVKVVLRTNSDRPTGSVIDRYRYPPQECEIGSDDELLMRGADAAVKFGDIVKHDRYARVLEVKKGRTTADVHPSSVFEAPVVHADALRKSLLRLCDAVDDPTCGIELLFQRPPRLTTGRFDPLVYESPSDFAIRLAATLDRTTLPVQGPPGSGKTYIGAQMIRALVRQGRKVGVVAASHKVIRNLLHAVRDQAAEAGETVRLGHKCDPDDDAPQDGGVLEIKGNPEALQAISGGEVDVLGGTAWLWAREEFTGAVDVLFVDEAGQMSLANALAVSPAAGSLVLLGDPQQLEQPQKASHPDGVDISALQHVLGDRQTMPPERGLFLPVTWRLAPAVCAFTSELFYEGKLHAREGLEHQRLIGTDGFDGAGLWWMPVPHDGNRNWSAEEVDAVEALVDRLVAPGTAWVDGAGATRPLTSRDLLVVAPYNAHVNRLAERLAARDVPVGTVDRFQGQEAAVVIYAMGTSLPDDAPRGLEFLYSLNRLNVATSRARCAVFVVASPRLLEPECRTPRQMQLANALCRYVEMATTVTPAGDRQT